MSKKADYTQQFLEVVNGSADDQAKFFLRKFVLEFKGNFEEVLELCAEFKKYAPRGVDPIKDLPEFECHLFLEKRGETLTVKALRDNLKEVHIEDKHRNVAFLEYALWKYKKSAGDLFAVPKGVSPELLRALDEAIDAYQAAIAARQAREDKMAELEKAAAVGGVKGMAAKNQLEQMKSESELELNKRELTTAAAKRKIQKAIEKDDGSAEAARLEAERQRLEALENERLQREKLEREEADRKAKEEARARLKAKAAAFEAK